MNVTSATERQIGNDSFMTPQTQSRDLLTALVVLTNIVSVIANLTIIIAIVFVEKLRKSLSSVYVFSLCILDLIASGTVIPKSVAVVLTGDWTWSRSLCVANGIFNAFLTFAVILTVCAIDLEKYYCIRYPMHHAGHMTRPTAIVFIAVSWLIALLFAGIPMAFWDGYTYRPKSLQCTYLWERKRQSVIFGIFITFLFLFIPLVLMLHINITMYRIAKRAMCQIEPISSNDNKITKTQVRLSIIVTGTRGQTTGSPEMTTSTTAATALSRNGSGVATDAGLSTDRASITSSSPFDIHTEAIRKIQSLQEMPANSRSTSPLHMPQQRRAALIRSETNYKALKNLIIPFMYFLIVWGSFFLVHLTWVTGMLGRNATIETACTLVVYVSYSLNPFVYGFMNKMFRDECVSLLQEKLFKSHQENHDPLPLPPSCENILEFLERTTCSTGGQRMETTENNAEQKGVVRPSVIDCRENLPTVDY